MEDDEDGYSVYQTVEEEEEVGVDEPIGEKLDRMEQLQMDRERMRREEDDDLRPSTSSGPERRMSTLMYGNQKMAEPKKILGKTFLSIARLNDALRQVMKGRFTVNKAAHVFGVPRSTLQRRVAQCREERKRYMIQKGHPAMSEEEMQKMRRRQMWRNYMQEYDMEESDARRTCEQDEREKCSMTLPSCEVRAISTVPRRMMEFDLLAVGSECIVQDTPESLDTVKSGEWTVEMGRGVPKQEEEEGEEVEEEVEVQHHDESLYEDDEFVVVDDFDGQDVREETVGTSGESAPSDEKEAELDEMPQLERCYQFGHQPRMRMYRKVRY